MYRKRVRLLLAAWVFLAVADAARAAFIGDFGFANSAMNVMFLWPFRIAGCG